MAGRTKADFEESERQTPTVDPPHPSRWALRDDCVSRKRHGIAPSFRMRRTRRLKRRKHSAMRRLNFAPFGLGPQKLNYRIHNDLGLSRFRNRFAIRPFRHHRVVTELAGIKNKWCAARRQFARNRRDAVSSY